MRVERESSGLTERQNKQAGSSLSSHFQPHLYCCNHHMTRLKGVDPTVTFARRFRPYPPTFIHLQIIYVIVKSTVSPTVCSAG